jgi:hypothetical protein
MGGVGFDSFGGLWHDTGTVFIFSLFYSRKGRLTHRFPQPVGLFVENTPSRNFDRKAPRWGFFYHLSVFLTDRVDSCLLLSLMLK